MKKGQYQLFLGLLIMIIIGVSVGIIYYSNLKPNIPSNQTTSSSITSSTETTSTSTTTIIPECKCSWFTCNENCEDKSGSLCLFDNNCFEGATTTTTTTRPITTTTISPTTTISTVSTTTTTTIVSNTCMNQCIRQGYVNGTCRGYVVYPGESICESNEVNIGQTEGCYVEEGRMGVGRTCCCGTNRIITQLTVAKDGSGNFTDIQQAIDYARELWGGTQKTIKIKSGTYIVNRYTKYPFVGYPFVGLVLPSNTIFQGEPGVIIKEVDGGIMERLITNEHSCTYNQTANKCQYMKSNLKDNNIIIKDLVIDGNGANQPYPYNSSRHCIWFLNVKDVTLDNVIVKNCAGIGIVTTWYSDIVVDKVSVSNCNGNGIYIDRGLNFFLDESIFENNSYSGIDIYLSNNVTVESCRVVESFAGSGINMDSVINSKISNCIINHNAEPGIWLWAEGGPWRPDHPEGGSETSNNVITGCTISNNGWRSQATGLPGQFDGIDFSHDSTYENTANHNTVNNNRIYDDQPQHTQRYAIGIAHPTDDYNFIADNYYWGNIKDSEGIVGFIRGVANHTTIEGNINHSP